MAGDMVHQDMLSSGDALTFNARHTTSAAARRASETLAAINAQRRNPTLAGPYLVRIKTQTRCWCHTVAVPFDGRVEPSTQRRGEMAAQRVHTDAAILHMHAEAVTPTKDLLSASRLCMCISPLP